MALSQQEALAFLKETLGISVFSERFASNKLEVLNDIIFQLHFKLPFENIVHLSRSIHDRKALPVNENILGTLLKGQGGICWDNNSTVCTFLQALGYNAKLSFASVVFSAPDSIGAHAIIFVNDVDQSGDTYLVELGFGCPCFKAVNLNFGKAENGYSESPIMKQSFQTFKYVKRGDTFVRMHKVSRSREAESAGITDDKWIDAYTFTLTDKPVEEIQLTISKVEYTDPNGVFNVSFRSNRFIKDCKFVAIKDKTFLEEDESGKLQPTEIKDEEHFLQLCQKYFPEIEQDVVRLALKNLPLASLK